MLRWHWVYSSVVDISLAALAFQVPHLVTLVIVQNDTSNLKCIVRPSLFLFVHRGLKLPSLLPICIACRKSPLPELSAHLAIHYLLSSSTYVNRNPHPFNPLSNSAEMTRQTVVRRLVLLSLISSLSSSTAARSAAVDPTRIFNLHPRDELQCPSDRYEKCGENFPGNFCCLKGATCVSVNNGKSAMCCPDQKKCAVISTFTVSHTIVTHLRFL